MAAAVAAALAVPALGWHSVRAQEAPGVQLEEITVTGSRIVRRDYQANSPIQTVDKSAFEQQNSIAIESALNDLPQFVPATQSVTQLQDQTLFTDTSASFTAGASTISLRGLGSNRNLVLLDGYRAMPVNATMAVDLNSIPAAAIDRVEVITGGASSVYGADAVAGVVNFILKKNFEGLDVDAQTGAMQNGEGAESRVSALFGINSADKRGNIMLGVEAAKRDPIYADDTDFWHNALRDKTVAGTQLIYTGPYVSVTSATSTANTRNVLNNIFNQTAPGTVLGSATAASGVANGNLYWNDDGTLYTGGESFNGTSPVGVPGSSGAYRYNGPTFTSRSNANIPGDFPFRQIGAEGEIIQHLHQFEANVPLDRNSVFGRASYDISDSVEAFVQTMNVSSKTRRYFTDSPATGGWATLLPHGTGIYAPSLNTNGSTNVNYQAGGAYGLNCPATGGCTNSQAFPVSPELASVLDARTDPNANWTLNYSLDFGDFGAPGNLYRSVFNETRTNQISVGLKGKVEALDGSWDVVVSKGAAKTDTHFEGFASVTRVRALLSAPNYGRGFIIQGNAAPPGNNFAGGLSTCTSGVPVFGNHGNISQDCLDVIFTTLNNQSQMDQKFFEANLQGHAFNMPAGEARFSAGAHSRENSYYYIFDPLQTQASFNDNPQGFPSNNTTGTTSVDELYGELLVPLLKDKAAVKHLNLELGYRYSDYQLQGGIDTYKALIDWGVTDNIRVRGGHQLATRAPNIAELFQANSQSFASQSLGEPCARNSQVAYGANPTKNPSAAQVEALCSAIIGVSAADYYAPAAQAQINGFNWNAFADATGNPNVKPEEAGTTTAGVVWSPKSVERLNFTADYYDIKIHDMIAVQSPYAVYEACLSPVTNPTFDPQNPACLDIHRNPVTGGASTTTVSYANTAFAEVEGIDITADWKTELAGGQFGVNFMVTTILAEKTQATANSPIIDWKGSLGPTASTSLNNGAYDYRTFTTVNYGRNDWNLSLRWRHLPTAIDATQASLNGSIDAGLIPATTRSNELGAEHAYDVFDLSGNWGLSEKLSLRYGVDNLADRRPVWTGGRTAADPHPTTGAGETEAGFYDILGRSFYVGVKASF